MITKKMSEPEVMAFINGARQENGENLLVYAENFFERVDDCLEKKGME